MINDQHMRTLGIEPRGERQLLTATSDQKPTRCETYDVSISTVTFGEQQLVIPALELMARPLFNHSIEGMIGRDVLSRIILQIDGPNSRFRIEY